MSDSVMKPCLWCQSGTTEFKNNQHWTGMRYHINSVEMIHWCGDGSGVFPRRRTVITAKTREECIAAWNTSATDPMLKEMAEALEDIVEYVDGTFSSTEMNNLCRYAKTILQEYREQVNR